MSVVPGERQQPLLVLLERRVEAHALLGQRAVERGAYLPRRRVGRETPVAKALVVAHHQVEHGVAPASQLSGRRLQRRGVRRRLWERQGSSEGRKSNTGPRQRLRLTA